MPPLTVPWCMPHANPSEASMRVLRPQRGEPLDGDPTTALQPAGRVKEHRNGEHPRS
jgi:hypothetical protein